MNSALRASEQRANVEREPGQSRMRQRVAGAEKANAPCIVYRERRAIRIDKDEGSASRGKVGYNLVVDIRRKIVFA